MKGVKKVISILVRIISIAKMLPTAKKPDHFACKMGLQTSLDYKVLASCQNVTEFQNFFTFLFDLFVAKFG
jgi:hypothetical protein